MDHLMMEIAYLNSVAVSQYQRGDNQKAVATILDTLKLIPCPDHHVSCDNNNNNNSCDTTVSRSQQQDQQHQNSTKNETTSIRNYTTQTGMEKTGMETTTSTLPTSSSSTGTSCPYCSNTAATASSSVSCTTTTTSNRQKQPSSNDDVQQQQQQQRPTSEEPVVVSSYNNNNMNHVSLHAQAHTRRQQQSMMTQQENVPYLYPNLFIQAGNRAYSIDPMVTTTSPPQSHNLSHTTSTSTTTTARSHVVRNNNNNNNNNNKDIQNDIYSGMYNGAFLLGNGMQPFALNEAVSVLSFNLALIFHREGVRQGRTSILQKALKLYERSIAIVGHTNLHGIMQQKSMIYIAMTAATCNNMAHIYNLFLLRPRGIVERLSQLVYILERNPPISRRDMEFFQLSIFFLKASTLNAAPAA